MPKQKTADTRDIAITHQYRVIADGAGVGWFSTEAAAINTAHFLRHNDPETGKPLGNTIDVQVVCPDGSRYDSTQIDAMWAGSRRRGVFSPLVN